jgi:hypothetical protein
MEFIARGLANWIAHSYLQISRAGTAENREQRVTTPFTMQSQDDRAPPQWLVSAFLVLLGVAIVASIPVSPASARGSIEATKAAQGLAERIVVRAKIQIRLLPPQPAASLDALSAETPAAQIAFAHDRIVPRAEDAGTRISQRGIKIRAPPAQAA